MNTDAFSAMKCARACPSSRLAARLPVGLRQSKASYASLIALLAPGILFATGLFCLRNRSDFSWLHHISAFPWELWTIVVSGILATVAGLGDWAFHRWVAGCVVRRKERNCELLALAGGGLPMFGLMSAASLSPKPQQFLLPALVVLIFVVTLICYDEFIFHRRRCRRMETILHRILVFGNGTAWLAWAHWCFVKGASHA